MLNTIDYLLTLLHLVIILFNLFGWLFSRLLKIHLMFATITLGCWFILGIWYGIGYCPVTDWQWDVKEQLGESNLPASFIKYYLDKISGKNIDADLVDWMTGIGFAAAICGSITRNIIKSKKRQRP